MTTPLLSNTLVEGLHAEITRLNAVSNTQLLQIESLKRELDLQRAILAEYHKGNCEPLRSVTDSIDVEQPCGSGPFSAKDEP